MSIPLHHLLIKKISPNHISTMQIKKHDKFSHFLTPTVQENISEVKPLAATQLLFSYTYL